MMQTAQRKAVSAFDEAISKPLLHTATETKGNQRLLHRQAASSSSSSHRHGSSSSSSQQQSPFNGQTSSFQESINRNAVSSYRPPIPTSREQQGSDIVVRQQQMLIMEQNELHGSTDLEEALLHERHGDFVSIRGDMQQINNIYKDLAHVVEAQQDDFDDMEMNLLNTQQSAEEGVKQLHTAAGLNLSQNVNDRFMRLGSGIFVGVAFIMLVYMLCR